MQKKKLQKVLGLVDKREYFRGYIIWGFVKKFLKNIFYVLSFSSLIAASIYMLLFASVFLMLFLYFYMFDEDPRGVMGIGESSVRISI